MQGSMNSRRHAKPHPHPTVHRGLASPTLLNFLFPPGIPHRSIAEMLTYSSSKQRNNDSTNKTGSKNGNNSNGSNTAATKHFCYHCDQQQ